MWQMVVSNDLTVRSGQTFFTLTLSATEERLK